MDFKKDERVVVIAEPLDMHEDWKSWFEEKPRRGTISEFESYEDFYDSSSSLCYKLDYDDQATTAVKNILFKKEDLILESDFKAADLKAKMFLKGSFVTSTSIGRAGSGKTGKFKGYGEDGNDERPTVSFVVPKQYGDIAGRFWEYPENIRSATSEEIDKYYLDKETEKAPEFSQEYTADPEDLASYEPILSAPWHKREMEPDCETKGDKIKDTIKHMQTPAVIAARIGHMIKGIRIDSRRTSNKPTKPEGMSDEDWWWAEGSIEYLPYYEPEKGSLPLMDDFINSRPRSWR